MARVFVLGMLELPGELSGLEDLTAADRAAVLQANQHMDQSFRCGRHSAIVSLETLLVMLKTRTLNFQHGWLGGRFCEGGGSQESDMPV